MKLEIKNGKIWKIQKTIKIEQYHFKQKDSNKNVTGNLKLL